MLLGHKQKSIAPAVLLVATMLQQTVSPQPGIQVDCAMDSRSWPSKIKTLLLYLVLAMSFLKMSIFQLLMGYPLSSSNAPLIMSQHYVKVVIHKGASVPNVRCTPSTFILMVKYQLLLMPHISLGGVNPYPWRLTQLLILHGANSKSTMNCAVAASTNNAQIEP